MNTAIATDPAAEAQSQKTFGQPFDTLNTNQQCAVVALLELPARLEAMKQEQRYCITCGKPSSLHQCMSCREGQSDGYRPRFHSIV